MRRLHSVACTPSALSLQGFYAIMPTPSHTRWHLPLPPRRSITDKAVLYITGGDNKQGQTPPQLQGDDELEVASLLAVSLHCVAAVLYQVPNQPIVFTDDVLRHSRSEDAAIAFTWDHYFRHPGSPEWLLRMPMTKAAVRAMDAVSRYVHDTKSSSISDWAVAGASKRGWTTWMVAAVDKRVKVAHSPVGNVPRGAGARGECGVGSVRIRRPRRGVPAAGRPVRFRLRPGAPLRER